MTDQEINIKIAGTKRAELFFKKVSESDSIQSTHVTTNCWLWKGAQATNGYGQFWNGRRAIPAHWFLKLGYDQMPHGKEACHKCDNKLCVRPSHIFIGSRSDNMRDCKNKGRLRPQNGCRAMLKVRKLHKGQDNHQSKLSEEDVKMVKSIAKQRGLGAALARHLNVSESVISGIWNGKRWTHIEPDATARQRAEASLRTLNKWES